MAEKQKCPACLGKGPNHTCELQKCPACRGDSRRHTCGLKILQDMLRFE
jgi:hypothetical protein